jgi:hypothetical protein
MVLGAVVLGECGNGAGEEPRKECEQSKGGAEEKTFSHESQSPFSGMVVPRVEYRLGGLHASVEIFGGKISQVSKEESGARSNSVRRRG